MAGGSIEKLKEILGHYSVVMTERYAHLRPDLFVDEERAAIPLDLTPGGAKPAEIGQTTARRPDRASATSRK